MPRCAKLCDNGCLSFAVGALKCGLHLDHATSHREALPTHNEDEGEDEDEDEDEGASRVARPSTMHGIVVVLLFM